MAAALAIGAVPLRSIEAQPPGSVSDWVEDPLLRNGFWSRTHTFRDDYDGPVTATVIRRPLVRSKACAVLYLHGYVDYFFQTELAAFYQDTLARPGVGRGCDFFAIDLRKYGRSFPFGYRFPNFAKSLNEYYPEISAALEMIHADGYDWVLLNGHSTGALVAARYLQDGPHREWVKAAFFNSPFLDFNHLHVKDPEAWFAKRIWWISPHHESRSPVSPWYARSLLRFSASCHDCHGRWDFDTRLKDLDGFPVFLGWVRAIAQAHDRVRKGGITQPILILHSARSDNGAGTVWRDEFRGADLVLDVTDMQTEGPKLGAHVRIRPIEGGVHDLVLSDPVPQAQVFREVTEWLGTLPGGPVGP